MDCSGIDFFPEAVKCCKDEMDLNVKCWDFMAEPIAGPFGCVSAQHVLEHSNNPVEFFKKIRSILVPDGIPFFAVPNYDSLLRILSGSNWLCLSE